MKKIRKRAKPLKLSKLVAIPIDDELHQTEFLPARSTKTRGRPGIADLRGNRLKEEEAANRERALREVTELFSMSQKEYEQLQQERDLANKRETAEMMKLLKSLK